MIYICIPAHNEARTIGVLLWKIRKVMAEFGRDYEVWVLDDGSTDETKDVLDRYERILPLRVASRKERLGYAGALDHLLRECVRRAPYPKRDAIVTLQGDFTESPDYIIPLIKTLEGGADLVAGRVEPSEDDRTPVWMRWTRKMAPIAAGKVVRGAPVSDPLCGFRAYRIIVLKKAIRERGQEPLLTSTGWAGNLQLLQATAHFARRVEEVPLRVRHEMRVRKSRMPVIGTLGSLYRLRRSGKWEMNTEGSGS